MVSLCSVDDVRAIVFSTTVTDQDILNIISVASDEVLALANSTDTSNSLLRLACIYASAAVVAIRTKFTSEMAAQIVKGPYRQQNQIDPEIKRFEDKATAYIKKYRGTKYSIPYARAGVGNVNAPRYGAYTTDYWYWQNMYSNILQNLYTEWE